MADVYVNSEELKLIASGMKTKATSIMESYQNEASSAILMGSECLQISGLDTTTLLNSFNKIFTNLGTRINTLADFLSTTVANEYDNTTAAIANEFNNNFANEIASILGISVGTGIGSSAATPWPDGEELDPGYTYPDKDTSSIGIPASWRRDGGTSSNEPTTLPAKGPEPTGEMPKLEDIVKKTTNNGNTTVDRRMDPDFGYPKTDSPGTGTVTPTPSNPGTTTGGTTIENPGSVKVTPWPKGVNLDPGFGYPRKENMSDNIIPKVDEIINIGSGTISGRPIYEIPVQPKPTPEIMSNNVIK